MEWRNFGKQNKVVKVLAEAVQKQDKVVKGLAEVVQRMNDRHGELLDLLENLHTQIDMLRSRINKIDVELKQQPESRDIKDTLLTLINKHGLERVQEELVEIMR